MGVYLKEFNQQIDGSKKTRHKSKNKKNYIFGPMDAKYH